MIKDFETERPPSTNVDTAILYADAMHMSRIGKRYRQLGKEMLKQGDIDGLAEIMATFSKQIEAASAAILELRKQINEGFI